MPTLLVVHHTTSPRLQAIFEAVMSGATTGAVRAIEAIARACWELGAAMAAGLTLP